MVTRETSNGTIGITDVYMGIYMVSAGSNGSNSFLQCRGLAPMNIVLIQFFKEYLDWLDAGADKSHQVFTRNSGLCVQLRNYMLASDMADVNKELVKKDFRFLLHSTCNGDVVYPFNKNGTAYIKESSANRCHTNKSRITWIKEQLKNA